MNPAVARAALAQLVVDSTGLPPSSVSWANRPDQWSGAQSARLRLAGYVSSGRDETLYDYAAGRPAGAELHPTAHGLRALTWEVQFTSHAATDALDALAMAMAVRDRLHLDEVAETLAAAGLGVEGVALLLHREIVQDHREMSVAQLDVRLTATSSAAGTPIGYVERWGIKGEAVTADGATVTIVDEVLP